MTAAVLLKERRYLIMDYTKWARDFFKDDVFATETAGIVIEEAREGYAKCSMEITKSHMNAAGAVMGGAVFTLADFTFAVAANSGSPVTVTMTSQITFLSPAMCEKLTATAECVKAGKRTATFLVTVTDDAGKQVATISTTGMRI